jgi:hypothetical protein
MLRTNALYVNEECPSCIQVLERKMPMRGSALRVSLWILAAVTAMGLCAANLWLGELNQDEGWYLYAAGRVAQGEMPFIDFAFTQGPVFPLFYALGHPLVEIWGVAGGRFFTAVLGLCTALVAAGCVRRMVRPPASSMAMLAVFSLIAINTYHSYFMTVVKTYALAGFWLALACWLLTFREGRRGLCAAAGAGVAFSLAAGTRISAAAILPLGVIWLLVNRSSRPGAWLAFGVAAGIACGVIFLPFLWVNFDAVRFGLWDYHTARTTGGSALTWWIYRGAFLSRVAQGYLVLMALWIWVLAVGRTCAMGWMEPTTERWGLPVLLWAGVLTLTAVHGLTPVPYDDYQAMLAPLLAVVLTLAACRRIETETGLQRFVITVVLVSILVAGASPINQEWFSGGRDRIWWKIKARTPLQGLRIAASAILPRAGADKLLLTQDTYLAVETGLNVPRGMELGPFCYYPEWSDERARRCHVLNRNGMDRLLRTTPAQVAAFSGYGLAIRSPEILPLADEEQTRLQTVLRERFHPVWKLADFGQGSTELTIYEH